VQALHTHKARSDVLRAVTWASSHDSVLPGVPALCRALKAAWGTHGVLPATIWLTRARANGSVAVGSGTKGAHPDGQATAPGACVTCSWWTWAWDSSMVATV
jgi:hypothetical protein